MKITDLSSASCALLPPASILLDDDAQSYIEHVSPTSTDLFVVVYSLHLQQFLAFAIHPVSNQIICQLPFDCEKYVLDFGLPDETDLHGQLLETPQ
ncbi:hypothetical protein JCM19240_3617 [Vibrio maritimus]|uniref:Uncharacterized protein n=1 Tax=Vibrio maritimus TaxID=990268 RepID=A0A090TWE1_9VIBR|nr:hypothetical protein JCM19240_3617 [Vibrio maritimus]